MFRRHFLKLMGLGVAANPALAAPGGRALPPPAGPASRPARGVIITGDFDGGLLAAEFTGRFKQTVQYRDRRYDYPAIATRMQATDFGGIHPFKGFPPVVDGWVDRPEITVHLRDAVGPVAVHDRFFFAYFPMPTREREAILLKVAGGEVWLIDPILNAIGPGVESDGMRIRDLWLGCRDVVDLRTREGRFRVWIEASLRRRYEALKHAGHPVPRLTR